MTPRSFPPALCWLLMMIGCGASATSTPAADLAVSLHELGDAHFVWVSAECSDGGLPLSRIGFERTLHLRRDGETLRATYDTRFVEPTCESTEVWKLTPQGAGYFRFQAQAVVSLPSDVACGAPALSPERGTLRATGDVLEEVRFASAWCHGYDVRFVYQRTPELPLDDAALLRRYVAHWNRRDADAIAALFADDATFIEPMTRTSDGQPARHEGRAAIRRWLMRAFSTTPWLALQMRSLEPLPPAIGDAGVRRWLVTFRYMDPRSTEPSRGRSLFVLVGEEILSSELQWLEPPRPRQPEPAAVELLPTPSEKTIANTPP